MLVFKADPIVVTGTITDLEGKPLAGASVIVQGTSRGTVTDEQGKFSIEVDENGTLEISAVGYLPQTINVTKRTEIDIVLAAGNSNLDEVVVQAYGTTTKRKSTSAIKTLDMDNVATLPVASINDAVAGRIPGIIVTASSGAPGAKSEIRIRGQVPIYVIDNVVRSANDFTNLNPNDIENYSVLTDAAATALYGNQGANGVVVVTTKRGRAGKVSINYAYNQIFSQPTLFPVKVGSYEQALQKNKLYAIENRNPYRNEADLEKLRTGSDPFNFPNTNWQDLVLKKFAPEMRHDLSVTSGTRLLTYYAGISYYDQGTILKTDKNYNKRTTYRLNTTSHFDNINLKVTTGIDGFVESNSQPQSGYGGVFSHTQNRSPEQLAVNEFGLPTTQPDNPVRSLHPESGYNKGFAKILNTNLGLEYSAHFLEGLKFRFNGNYTTYNNVGKVWNYLAPAYLLNSTSPIFGNPPSLSVSQGQGSTTTLQGYIIYNKVFGDHSVEFNGIAERVTDESSNVGGSRVGYQIIYDQLVAGPALNQSVNGGEFEAARAGLVGRLTYSFKSRYTIEGSVRRDGDYLFPPDKQWGTFYAISGNYVLSEESFMQNLKANHIIDFAKLRASYGVLGDKTGVGAFGYVSSYSINPQAYVINGNIVQGTSEPGTLPSNIYSWQTIGSRNFGIDIASFNNRLNATFDYFYTRRTGFVTSDPRFASTLGIGLPQINFDEGALRSEGFDFNINWSNKFRDLTYKIGFNYGRFNTLRERAVEDDATLRNPYTRATNVANDFLTTGYTNDGFYTDNSQLLTGARRINSINVGAGDLRYKDTNGDGQINGDDFRRIGGNTLPRSNYGITIDVGYKGAFFTAVVQGSGNRDRYASGTMMNLNGQDIFMYEFQADYWRPDNTDALLPRAVSSGGVNGSNNTVSSDFWVVKSKYIRLKYLQLGYDFKQGVFKRSPFQSLRLFASGTNLLTSSAIQKYFIDPESNGDNYDYPIQRTISFGLNVGF